MASLLLRSIASTALLLLRFCCCYSSVASTALLFLRFCCFYGSIVSCSIASMALLIGIPVVQEKSLRKTE